jgi:hypothetical protein
MSTAKDRAECIRRKVIWRADPRCRKPGAVSASFELRELDAVRGIRTPEYETSIARPDKLPDADLLILRSLDHLPSRFNAKVTSLPEFNLLLARRTLTIVAGDVAKGAAMVLTVTADIAKCYRQAAECQRFADEAHDPATRNDFLDMQRRWLALASSYEFSQRLSDFTCTISRQRNKSSASG